MEQGIGSSQVTTLSREKQVSRGITAIYKDFLGRGPTHTKTVLSDDCALTTLTDSLTRAERVLVESGEADTVREMRRKFQFAMREEITACVEAATNRKCAAFLSDHDPLTDVAVEMVVFATDRSPS